MARLVRVAQRLSPAHLSSWCCAHGCGAAGWSHELVQEAGGSLLLNRYSFGDCPFVCLFVWKWGFIQCVVCTGLELCGTG